MGFKVDNGQRRIIRYSEVMRFFNASGRSVTCPFCSYTGSWTIHIDGHALDQGDQDPPMAIFSAPVKFPSRPDLLGQYAELLAVECPQCSHMEFIHASRVQQFLEAPGSAPA